MEISPADPLQAKALRDLYLATWEATYRSHASESWYAEGLAAHAVRDWGEVVCSQVSRGGGVLTACCDGRIVGLCQYGPTEDDDEDPRRIGHIRRLCVHPARQRAGVGRSLLTAAVECLRRGGAHAATLWVLETDERARAFYAALGWRPDGTRKDPDLRYRLSLRPSSTAGSRARACLASNEKENPMGRIVVTEFISVDGVMESPGPVGDFKHAGWTFAFDRGEEGNQFKVDELFEAEAQLLGRVTYEDFTAAWPTMEGMGEFGERMNNMPKYVFSSTLETASWTNSTILRGDFAEAVGKLKRDVDGVILVAGSAQLVQGLLEHGLADEVRLMVFPIILGSGKRLFTDSPDKTTLRLADSKIVGDGVAILTYQPA
jgi:dihydrofolate reductase/ribosomal protein S18 acetylase RimI-like enzyme